MPDTLLYYITIQYFIFFDFLIFCTSRKQNVGKAYVVCARSGRVRCMNEMSMGRVCSYSVMQGGMIHAPEKRERISEIQDSLVFQKRL